MWTVAYGVMRINREDMKIINPLLLLLLILPEVMRLTYVLLNRGAIKRMGWDIVVEY